MGGLSSGVELERIAGGGCDDRVPAGFDVFRVYARANGDARDVLGRVREVMSLVARDTNAPWPSDEEWLRVLPAWFVQASPRENGPAEPGMAALPAEVAGEEIERWAVDSFVYWFEPEQREWWWWGADIVSDDELVVCLAVHEFTVFHAALDWLLYASGAVNVEDENLRELRGR